MKFVDSIVVCGKKYKYFSVEKIAKDYGVDPRLLPRSIKVILENLMRNNCVESDVKSVLGWDSNHNKEIHFTPTQVLMQDFTGVPAIVDLASMRDAAVTMGKDPYSVNPRIKVNLVIDHSVQVDKFGNEDAFQRNIDMEMQRNGERYKFLKWGQKAFKNFSVIPPGTGICHQVNLEYIASVVSTFADSSGEEFAAIDTVIGTDSHTTMINALSVLGWGVGGIEAEAVMLGQSISMLIPEVIGVELIGSLKAGVTATDLVLTLTNMLRSKGVVQKFVEFYGEGMLSLSVADRATIANMSPEYGATCGFFPCDEKVLEYLYFTGREKSLVDLVSAYCKAQNLFIDGSNCDPVFTSVLRLDLGSVETCLAGPKRPQDRVVLSKVPDTLEKADSAVNVFGNHSVVIAAITSCTNTSNPSVMIAAGLVAKKACEIGLSVKPWVKTSLAPGSKVVSEYLRVSGLQLYLDKLGFNVVGYGCTTCIGNSGPLDVEMEKAIVEDGLKVAAVLSGNRNFEGRIHNKVKLNYLASPPLVVAYALAGTVGVDLTQDAIGNDSADNPVYLNDIWPSDEEIRSIESDVIKREMFIDKYSDITEGTYEWKQLICGDEVTYNWDPDSTYIRRAPYFEMDNKPVDILNANILMLLGDSITTDHISPAGAIACGTVAACYLESKGFDRTSFNSYGSRRGNHEVMIRGTFSNVRIRNLMIDKEGGFTRHFPDGKVMSVYDASKCYQEGGVPLVIVAGREYGTGSSRDWAAKGTMLLGVKAVIAISFERIHHSNLIGMGVLPLLFENPEDFSKFDGDEKITIKGVNNVKIGDKIECLVEKKGQDKEVILLKAALYTQSDIKYFAAGGVLNYVLNKH